MYGIFTYMYHKLKPNVGECSIHGAYGTCCILLNLIKDDKSMSCSIKQSYSYSSSSSYFTRLKSWPFQSDMSIPISPKFLLFRIPRKKTSKGCILKSHQLNPRKASIVIFSDNDDFGCLITETKRIDRIVYESIRFHYTSHSQEVIGIPRVFSISIHQITPTANGPPPDECHVPSRFEGRPKHPLENFLVPGPWPRRKRRKNDVFFGGGRRRYSTVVIDDWLMMIWGDTSGEGDVLISKKHSGWKMNIRDGWWRVH